MQVCATCRQSALQTPAVFSFKTPAIGAKVLANADTILNDDGTTSFIPNANIFLVALIVLMFVWVVMIPLYKKEKSHAE